MKISYYGLGSFYSLRKKYILNQQAPFRCLETLIGASETIRTQKNIQEIKFNQWLAGLIDGDGYLLVTKDGYSGCEITVALEDEQILRVIQNKIGGRVKLRSGVKAIRYRLNQRKGMINLITRINGFIRNSRRLPQLHKVCQILNIEPVLPQSSMGLENRWFLGCFDADGTINYYPQIILCQRL